MSFLSAPMFARDSKLVSATTTSTNAPMPSQLLGSPSYKLPYFQPLASDQMLSGGIQIASESILETISHIDTSLVPKVKAALMQIQKFDLFSDEFADHRLDSFISKALASEDLPWGLRLRIQKYLMSLVLNHKGQCRSMDDLKPSSGSQGSKISKLGRSRRSLGESYDLSRASTNDRPQMDINKDEDEVGIDESISFPSSVSMSGQVCGPKCLFNDDDDDDDNDDRDCTGPSRSSGTSDTSIVSHVGGKFDSLHQILDQDAHFSKLEVGRLNEDHSLFHNDSDIYFYHDGVCSEFLNAWVAGIVDPISLFFHIDTEIDSGRIKPESGAFFKKAVLNHGGHSMNYLQAFEKRQIFTVNKVNLVEIDKIWPQNANSSIIYSKEGSNKKIELTQSPAKVTSSFSDNSVHTSVSSSAHVWRHDKELFNICTVFNSKKDKSSGVRSLISIGGVLSFEKKEIDVDDVISFDYFHSGRNSSSHKSSNKDMTRNSHAVILILGRWNSSNQFDLSLDYKYAQCDGDSDFGEPDESLNNSGGSGCDEGNNEVLVDIISIKKRFYCVFATVCDGCWLIDDISPISNSLCVDQQPLTARLVLENICIVSGTCGLLALVLPVTLASSLSLSRISASTSNETISDRLATSSSPSSAAAALGLLEIDSESSQQNNIYIINSDCSDTNNIDKSSCIHNFSSSVTAVCTSEDGIIVSGDSDGILAYWDISFVLLTHKLKRNKIGRRDSFVGTGSTSINLGSRIFDVNLMKSGLNVIASLFDRLLLISVNAKVINQTVSKHLYVRSVLDLVEGQRAIYGVHSSDDFIRIWRATKTPTVTSTSNLLSPGSRSCYNQSANVSIVDDSSSDMDMNQGRAIDGKSMRDSGNFINHTITTPLLNFDPSRVLAGSSIAVSTWTHTNIDVNFHNPMQKLSNPQAFFNNYDDTSTANARLTEPLARSLRGNLFEQQRYTSSSSSYSSPFSPLYPSTKLGSSESNSLSSLDSLTSAMALGIVQNVQLHNEGGGGFRYLQKRTIDSVYNQNFEDDGGENMYKFSKEKDTHSATKLASSIISSVMDTASTSTGNAASNRQSLFNSLSACGSEDSTHKLDSSSSTRMSEHSYFLITLENLFVHDCSGTFTSARPIIAVFNAMNGEKVSIGILAACLDIECEEALDRFKHPPLSILFAIIGRNTTTSSTEVGPVAELEVTSSALGNAIFAWICSDSMIGNEFWIDSSIGHSHICALYLRYCGNKSVAIECPWQEYLRIYGPLHLRKSSRVLRLLTEGIRKIDETANIKDNLPRQLGFITGLQEIYARRVGLKGRIPKEIGQLSQLRVLSMGNNLLCGELPESLGNLTNLQRIVLHQNRIAGAVPRRLAELGCIVNLAGNPSLEYGQEVPQEEIHALVDLFHSTKGSKWITKTNWCSDLPVCKWYKVGVLASRVHSIVMSSNGMEGKIPHSINELSHLRMIELATMPSLGGPIPSQLCQLKYLRRLCICRCGLTGAIPNEIGNLVTLEELQLFGNNLSGIIPEGVGKLINLKLLSLGEYTGGNDFEPALIPTCISKLINLEALFMANCNFKGAIPNWICNLTELRQLDLQRNYFSGIFPVSICSLSNLLYLNLKDNETLTGPLPLEEMANLTKLNRLSLVHCSFSDPQRSLEVLSQTLTRCKIWI